jgi:hypothetical protein
MKKRLIIFLFMIPLIMCGCSSLQKTETSLYGLALIIFTPGMPEMWSINQNSEAELVDEDYYFPKKDCKNIAMKYIDEQMQEYPGKAVRTSENYFTTSFPQIVYCYPKDITKGYFTPYYEGSKFNFSDYKYYPLFTDDPSIKKYHEERQASDTGNDFE